MMNRNMFCTVLEAGIEALAPGEGLRWGGTELIVTGTHSCDTKLTPPITLLITSAFSFFSVLGLELRTFTLRQSTSPFFVMIFSR
jgi:hypothetical protein